MRRQLFEMFGSSNDLAPETIGARLAVASIIACFVFLSYRISHLGSIYSKKFNVSLVVLTVITTTVMIVIGNNLAMSLGDFDGRLEAMEHILVRLTDQVPGIELDTVPSGPDKGGSEPWKKISFT